MILTSTAFNFVESTHTDSYLSKTRTCRPIEDPNLQIIHHLRKKTQSFSIVQLLWLPKSEIVTHFQQTILHSIGCQKKFSFVNKDGYSS